MDAASPRKRPVFARHAASLVLWRYAPEGAEVLMGLRGAGHRFMPNRLVFPGGAVDKSDNHAVAATEPDPTTLAMLQRNAGPRLARALVVAAARELQEEAGLSFGSPPRLDAIDYLCRAVTPPALHMRFNARFLIAEAAAVEGQPADSRELEAVRFYPIEQALELNLMAVTREVLLRVQEYLGLEGAARRQRTQLFAYIRDCWVPEKAVISRPLPPG